MSAPSPASTEHRIREALAAAPLGAKQLAQAAELPLAEVREALPALVAAGAVHSCTHHRYWTQSERDVLLAAARRRLFSRPATAAQLVQAMKKLGTGAPKAYLKRLVQELQQSDDVHVWPPHGRYRVLRLATAPPDLDAYLAKVRVALEPVLAKLTAVGTSREEIVEALLPGVLSSGTGAGAAEPEPDVENEPPAPERPPPRPPPEAADEAERDFHRELSQELVFAWEDAEERGVRESLARVMWNMGLRRLGEPGEEVPFDGLIHLTDDDLLPDDPAVVVEPGWQLLRGSRSRVLGKARVRSPEASA